MTRKNIGLLTLMVIIGMGIFAYSLKNVSIQSLVKALVNINIWWLLVAVFCICMYFVIEAFVVQRFMIGQHKRFTFKNAIRIPLIEQLFNGITPFSTGGQPAQLFAMAQSGVDAGRASSILLMKFVVYQAMIVINFIVCLLIGFQYIQDKVNYLMVFVIFGFVIHLAVITALLMIMYWYGFTKKLVYVCMLVVKLFVKGDRFDRWNTSIYSKIENFHKESLRMKNEKKMIFHVFVLTFFQLAFYYLIPYFIMLSLGYTSVNVIMITALHVLIVMVISLFPIPGGTGGAEYSFAIVFSSFMTSHSKLILAMLLWRILTYYVGLFAGMFALVVKPDKVEEVGIED
ncbi:YbhN family protein [Dellaglioa sp. P0083]|uniref:lysylphosphatidylglycerol synthase transmembrane domain-containing protein n=1 Tax=Dellaglioa kimchii TaxID=3344667 RepID=UPI0038D3DC9E